MFWKFVVSALLLPSLLGFETATAHLVNKVQNQPQSQESALPFTSTLANQSEEDVSIQHNLETDTTQVKQTKYEYYQRIHQERLRRYRQKVHSRSYRHHRRACPDRRYNQNRVYYPQNRHPRRHNYRCQYYSHGRCYN